MPIRVRPKSAGRRRRWGWIWVVSLVLGTCVFVVFYLEPFLAPTQTVPSRYLVVEGWIPYAAMAAAAAEYRRGGYERVFSIGIPFRSFEGAEAKGSFASSGAAQLQVLGIPAEAIAVIPMEPARRNRTFEAALALRDYCVGHSIPVESVNLVSSGAHARRSQLCLQRALGREVKVGVIAVEDQNYDPRRWWKYSEGVKEVLGEALAYTYAWFTIDYGK